MKKLILILSDVPDVGKTVLGCVMHEYLKRHGIGHRMVDTGEGRDSLTRCLEDVYPICVDESAEMSEIVTLLDESDTVVLDVCTGGLRVVCDFFEDNEFSTILTELDTELTLVIPVSHDPDSYDEVVRIGEAFSDNADYVLVHTPLGDPSGNRWNDSYAAKVTHYLGGIEVSMPALDGNLVDSLAAMGVELGQGIQQPNRLVRAQSRILKTWENQFMDQLELASEYLLTEEREATPSVYSQRAFSAA